MDKRNCKLIKPDKFKSSLWKDYFSLYPKNYKINDFVVCVMEQDKHTINPYKKRFLNCFTIQVFKTLLKNIIVSQDKIHQINKDLIYLSIIDKALDARQIYYLIFSFVSPLTGKQNGNITDFSISQEKNNL